MLYLLIDIYHTNQPNASRYAICGWYGFAIWLICFEMRDLNKREFLLDRLLEHQASRVDRSSFQENSDRLKEHTPRYPNTQYERISFTRMLLWRVIFGMFQRYVGGFRRFLDYQSAPLVKTFGIPKKDELFNLFHFDRDFFPDVNSTQKVLHFVVFGT